MNQYALPRSYLHRLGREVLSGPPEAALPCNLPDDWLNLIARDLDFALEGIDDQPKSSRSYASAPLALILHILHGQRSGGEISVHLDVLRRYFEELRIEVNSEILKRRRMVDVESATLSSIFSAERVAAPRIVPGVGF